MHLGRFQLCVFFFVAVGLVDEDVVALLFLWLGGLLSFYLDRDQYLRDTVMRFVTWKNGYFEAASFTAGLSKCCKVVSLQVYGDGRVMPSFISSNKWNQINLSFAFFWRSWSVRLDKKSTNSQLKCLGHSWLFCLFNFYFYKNNCVLSYREWGTGTNNDTYRSL